MAFSTIVYNSGGNHGHKLKDFFGGLTISKLYDFKLVHNTVKTLNFFAIDYKEPKLNLFHKLFLKKVIINKTAWDGLDLDLANKTFLQFKNKKNVLIYLEKATRIHPCQTIKWYKEKLIDKDVFSEIVKETTLKFYLKHKNYKNSFFKNDVINIAMHIDRGKNYDPIKFPLHFSNPFEVRYQFPIQYYWNIYEQLAQNLKYKFLFHIFFEKSNSKEIIETFKNEKNVILHIGPDRNEYKHNLVYNIFYHFVMSDVFIASNSSFSAVVAYFRWNKPMIYHPHRHLFDLPEENYLPTNESGFFDVKFLIKKLEKNYGKKIHYNYNIHSRSAE